MTVVSWRASDDMTSLKRGQDDMTNKSFFFNIMKFTHVFHSYNSRNSSNNWDHQSEEGFVEENACYEKGIFF